MLSFSFKIFLKNWKDLKESTKKKKERKKERKKNQGKKIKAKSALFLLG